jgi:hypothetical protein
MMKMKNQKVLALAGFLAAIAFITSCQKTSSLQTPSAPGQQSVTLYLTDAPGVFDNVFIDIQSVKIKVDTCEDNHPNSNDDNSNDDHHNGNDDHGNDNELGDDHGGNHSGTDDHCEVWQTLNIHPGVYDLLTLRNGIDTLLAHGDNVTAGSLDEIEITLGVNNSVVIDGTEHPLSLDDNTISIKVSDDDFDEFSQDHSRLWLDFDVAGSIVQENDLFILKPVIRFFNLNETGEVKGRVNPSTAVGSIKIYNNTDTASALPDHEGEFEVRGLTPGTYTIFIDATGNYNDVMIDNVVISNDGKKDIGSIQLHQ